jgi:plasmid stabilization system protein ParE
MVHIISKRDGPGTQDAAARALIEKNRTTIANIANHLSGGRRREMRHPGSALQREASGKLWFTAPGQPREPSPYVRISLNGRVVVADLDSGRQLHFIGDIRGAGAARRFALATRENGFYAPLDDDLLQALFDLDRMALPESAAEERLEREIGARLGLTKTDNTAD